MNTLRSIELCYESLVPVSNPDGMFLSVGTVTLLSDQELHLDFNCTSTSWYPKGESFIELHTTLSEFEPDTYEDEYLKMGIAPEDLNFFFFATRKHNTYITEVFTEYYSRVTEQYIPLTLKGIQLHFDDGSFLDYSDSISIFALEQLAEVA